MSGGGGGQVVVRRGGWKAGEARLGVRARGAGGSCGGVVCVWRGRDGSGGYATRSVPVATTGGGLKRRRPYPGV
jgi:hypothetical protein